MVDPLFPARLRELRQQRGLSLRDLAARTHHGKSYLCDLERGRRTPSADVAKRLDDALGAEGALMALVSGPDEWAERIGHSLTHPGRVDPAAVDALTGRLAQYRHLDDVAGSAAILPATMSQLSALEGLLRQAYGPHRPALVGIAAQWAQFTGWLNIARGRPDRANLMLDRALEWASEVGDEDLTATTISFKGHVAWTVREPGPLIGLTQAALRHKEIYVGQLAYDWHQLARGFSLVGDHRAVRESLAVGVDLADEAAEDDGRRPPWHYYRSRAFFDLEAGVVLEILGDHERAAELLAAGLAGLPEDMREAEWTVPYRESLAAAAGCPQPGCGR